ncbi:MAG TPA: trypsin-like peptidase domain-containing protein [Caulobacteraceae bacterium]|jgi:serine protease Do
MQSNKLKTLASSGLAIVAMALSGVAIYTTEAGAQTGARDRAAHEAGKPVNTPAPAPTSAAPASFADIVERVAPAVVSIDIEEKGPTRAAFRHGAPRSEDQDDGDGGGGGLESLPPELRRFFEQHGRQGQDQGQGQGQGQQDEQPQEPLRASGSGFFISRDGYIVTNNHVVENAATITVKTNDDRELKAKLVGRDPATDLAVIKVDGAAFPYVSFEDKGKPRVGDWVIALGNPFGLGGTATAGIVSALSRPSEGPYVDYMQIDAPINRGNSGGPSFDMNGRVVGVNSAIYTPSGGSVGIGFDIPADVVQKVSHTLIDHGKVVRGYLGATIQGVTPEIAESLGLKGKKGALIASTTTGGPAAKAGLQTGDLVQKIDGHEVDSQNDLTRQVALVAPGQEMRLTVLRDGKVQELTVKSGERPSEEALASNDQQDQGDSRRGR